MDNCGLFKIRDLPVDIAQMIDWAKRAGRMALSNRQSLERILKNGSIVTSADDRIENFLIGQIRLHYPDHAILSEEIGYLAGNDHFLWVLDPIDGTRAYASGLPIWGVSIGFLVDGKPVVGLYFMPAIREMYLGGGGKAYFNGKQILPVLGNVVEDPSMFLAVPSSAFRGYEIAYPRVRSLGSVAAHLAYAARGIAIGVLTRQLQIWDIAGIYPMLQATGIAIQYLNGEPFHFSHLMGGKSAKEPLLAARPDLLGRLRASIKVKEFTKL